MNLDQLIGTLRMDPEFMANVAHWETIPAKPARYAGFPEGTDPKLIDVLHKRGIHSLYSHQREAIDLAAQGKDICIVTPTASGKTLCYNLPVLSEIMRNPDARALYLFPTKALSADQVAELYELIEAMQIDIKTYTYDGDTPAAARRAVRQAGHIVVTNPDMLHSGILPHHTKWVKLFENLKYIIIDEIHVYRGVFGSNLGNVIRRLMRLCAFYGSHPQFICCSATIANPDVLAETLIGRPVTLINQSGAASGERHVIFYNPPVVNEQLSIRASALQESIALASRMVDNDISTIVFAKSRVSVEVITRHLKERVREPLGNSGKVRGYRGGYLPSLRREIEQGLRSGRVRAVVSTNALELGIDIGQLDVCIMCGYPGTIASTWQEAGRAGRRKNTALTILVASSSALDQYIVSNPSYFFGHSPENALVHPDNLYVLMNHLKCAAYELPFKVGDSFSQGVSTAELLDYLSEQHILQRTGDRYYWTAEEFPAADLSLRSVTSENFLIIDISNTSDVLTNANPKVIGEMDRFTAPMLLHEHAIYLHEGQQYQVEKLDFTEKKAYVRAVDVDYYTDADLNTSIKVIDVLREQKVDAASMAFGEIVVTWLVTMFKKFKLDTQESLGFGPVDLPELEMPTEACWWALEPQMTAGYSMDDLQGGMLGLANALRQILPLYLMCSPHDLCVKYHVRDPFTQKPTLIVFDNYAGGIGLSEKVYGMKTLVFEDIASLISRCPCEAGCPSCVGPQKEVGAAGKRVAHELAERLKRL